MSQCTLYDSDLQHSDPETCIGSVDVDIYYFVKAAHVILLPNACSLIMMALLCFTVGTAVMMHQSPMVSTAVEVFMDLALSFTCLATWVSMIYVEVEEVQQLQVAAQAFRAWLLDGCGSWMAVEPGFGLADEPASPGMCTMIGGVAVPKHGL